MSNLFRLQPTGRLRATHLIDQGVSFGNAISTEQHILTPGKRAFAVDGPADSHYSFGIRAFRDVDVTVSPDGRLESPVVRAPEGAYQPVEMPVFAGDITGTIAGRNADLVSASSLNFDSRNDRNGIALVVPTVLADGSAIDHTINTDGSADVSFEWQWAGAEADIDGFVVYVYQAGTNAAYTFGSTPAAEVAYTVPADKRAIVLYGIGADRYTHFGVQAYRIVDGDIDPTGLIKSVIVKPSLGAENPYQPAASIAFAGNISGTINGTAVATVTTAVTNFNNRNDRDATAVVVPTIAGDGTAVDHVINTDGSADVSFEWLWGGAEVDIDGFEILLYSSTSASAYTIGTTAAAEMVIQVPANKRAWIVTGINPTTYLTFAVRAYRVVDEDVNAAGVIRSAWVKPGLAAENPYRPAASVAFAGDVTGTVNAVAVATVTTAVTNFNNRNDRVATAVVAPTIAGDGSAVDHVVNPNGSADVSFEWLWGGTEADIDGFEVMLYSAGTNAAYTPGTTPASEQVMTLQAHKRAVIMSGVSITTYLTFAVRAFRIVDPDVNAAGVIRSAWVKPALAGENPYQPAATAAFTGDITGTINGTSAATVATAVGNFNGRNDRNAAALTVPTIAGDGTSVDHVLNPNGSADVSFEWLWGGTEADIDGFEVMLYSAATNAAYTPGTTASAEQVMMVPANKRALIVSGVSVTTWLTFAVRAYRIVDTDVNAAGIIRTAWVKPALAAENPYQPSATAAFSGNITGTINGTAVATVTTAVTNFNGRNDRTATAVVAPTIAGDGTAVDHVINTDGSADVSFEWLWGGSEVDIDGFELMVYVAAVNTAYTPNTTPAAELVLQAPANKRAMILTGVNPTSWITFAVRAYRTVDPDINATGILRSAWVKPGLAAENPYQPATSVAFAGNVTGTIGGDAVNSVVRASNPITAGNVTTYISNSAILSAQIADAQITTAKFAAGIAPVEIVGTLPVSGNFEGRTAYLTTDNKLYRHDGANWISSVPATDVTGQLTNSQLADIAAAKVTGQLAATQLNIAIGGGNLASNSSFEVDTNADGWADNWGLYTGFGTPTLSATAHHGAKSQSVVTLGAIAVPRICQTGGRKLVLSGQQVVLSARIKVAAGQTAYLNAKGFTAATAGAETWQGGVDGTLATDNTWQRITTKVTPNVDCYLSPMIGLSGTPAAGITVLIDSVQVELGDMLTAYAPAPDEILPSTITATEIADNAVTTNKIIANAITAAKIAANTITASQIAANTITAAEIAANAITASELAANAVTAGKIAAGTIVAADIAANTITASQIAANTITASQIAANTITASQIAADTITAGQIAAGAISASEIAAGAIRTDKLLVTGQGAAINQDPNTVDLSAWSGGTLAITADTTSPTGSSLAITSTGSTTLSTRVPLDASKNYDLRLTAKQQSGTATCYLGIGFYNGSDVLLDGTTYPSGWTGVGTFHYYGLVNSAPPGSYTEYRVSFGPNETKNIPTGAKYARLVILGNYAAAGEQRFTSIRLVEKATADLIVDGSITAAKIAANTITANEIAASAITSSELAANAVIAGKIAAGTIVAADIAASTITAAKIAANTITASELAITDQTNFVPNGGFQNNNMDNWSAIGAGYAVVPGTNADVPVSYPTQYVLEVTANNAGAYTSSVFFDCQAGEQVALKCKATRGAGTYTASKFRIIAYWKKTDGSLTSAVNSYFEPTTSWGDFSAILTAPAATVGVRFRVFRDTNTDTSKIYVTAIEGRKMNAGSLVVDGSISATKITAGTITADRITVGTITYNELSASTITTAATYSNTASAALDNTTETEAGTISLTTTSATDEVLLWGRIYLDGDSAITTASVVEARLRLTSTSGTVLDGPVSPGTSQSSYNTKNGDIYRKMTGTVALMATHTPGGVGTYTYKLTAKMGSGQGDYSNRLMIGLLRKR